MFKHNNNTFYDAVEIALENKFKNEEEIIDLIESRLRLNRTDAEKYYDSVHYYLSNGVL